MPTASPPLTLPLAAVLLAIAAASATMGLRGRSGTLSREGRLGVRTPASLAGDDAFDVANRVAAPIALGTAVIDVALAALIVLLPLSTPAVLVVFAVALIATVTLLITAGSLGDRAARHVPVPARRPASDGAGCGGCGCGEGGCSKLTRNGRPSAGSA